MGWFQLALLLPGLQPRYIYIYGDVSLSVFGAQDGVQCEFFQWPLARVQIGGHVSKAAPARSLISL